MSRLRFRCTRCDRVGSRNDSFRLRPEHTPAFDDVCPSCGSNNVEVFDPVVAERVRGQVGKQEEVRP